ncbi:MAG: ABC transporter ATP-binding protein [Caldilineaceae bacterium]
MTALLSVDGLTKSYGSTLALDDLSLTVASGAVFGLLGPNGSGKSTLIRLVLGFLHPDAGRIDFAGGERTIGYLPDRPAMPFGARLIEYLELMGKLAGLERSSLRRRARQQLADVGLIHAAEWRVGACSRGMLQRLALAAALIHDPALVILDEPLNGLDPAGQHAMRAQIQRIHAAGHTLLVSTHRLNDIAPLCTHLAILHRGQLVRSGAQAELFALAGKCDLPCAAHERVIGHASAKPVPRGGRFTRRHPPERGGVRPQKRRVARPPRCRGRCDRPRSSAYHTRRSLPRSDSGEVIGDM